LSGIVLVLDNKILLVNAKKRVKEQRFNTWSIPKGKQEEHLTALDRKRRVGLN